MIRLTRGTPSSGWNLSLEELLFGLLSEGRFFRFSVESHAGRAEFRLSDGEEEDRHEKERQKRGRECSAQGARADSDAAVHQCQGKDADVRVDDRIVGGAFSYSDSSYDLDNGDVDGYIKNDVQAGNMDIDFDSNAFSLSVEGDHTFKFMERAYVEPQIEVTYGFAQGDDATASNGVKIEQYDYQNLITRIAFRTGFDFPN